MFGTPTFPRAFGGTPGINGLPPKARNTSGGQWTTSKSMTPFGDEAVVMGNGRLEIRATDVTAIDAATTDDEVKFRASWEDEQGNTCAVECCQMLATPDDWSRATPTPVPLRRRGRTDISASRTRGRT